MGTVVLESTLINYIESWMGLYVGRVVFAMITQKALTTQEDIHMVRILTANFRVILIGLTYPRGQNIHPTTLVQVHK